MVRRGGVPAGEGSAGPGPDHHPAARDHHPTLNSVSDNSEKVICFPLNLFILTELSDQAWSLLSKDI